MHNGTTVWRRGGRFYGVAELEGIVRSGATVGEVCAAVEKAADRGVEDKDGWFRRLIGGQLGLGYPVHIWRVGEAYWGSIAALGLTASDKSADAVWATLDNAQSDAVATLRKDGIEAPTATLPTRLSRRLLALALFLSLATNLALLWRAADPIASKESGLTRAEIVQLLGVAGVLVAADGDGPLHVVGAAIGSEFLPADCHAGRCRSLIGSLKLQGRPESHRTSAEHAALRINRETSGIRCWADSPQQLACATDLTLRSIDPVDFGRKVLGFLSIGDHLIEIWART